MKIIDLLNKIANGEEVPIFRYANKRIKYNKEENWLEDLDNDEYCSTYIQLEDLNDEVEIIEEPKKIERILKWTDTHSWLNNNNIDKALQEQSDYNEILYYKINEIIDKLNEMSDKK